jgi:hypothetical protein
MLHAVLHHPTTYPDGGADYKPPGFAADNDTSSCTLAYTNLNLDTEMGSSCLFSGHE